MKHLLLFILCCMHFNVRAQTALDNFYNEGASWCEGYYYGIGHGNYLSGDSLHIIGGVISVNAKDYLSVYCKGKLLCGIRTDSEKVYVLSLDTNFYQGVIPYKTEAILYDFNLKVGDSVSWVYQYRKTVVSIDSVLLTNNTYTKRYNFDTGSMDHREYWLYGIGSSRGLFGTYNRFPPYHNKVYMNNGMNYMFQTYIPVYLTTCFPTAIAAMPVDPSSFRVYPNPLQDEVLHVTTSVACVGYRVTDIMGKVIYNVTQPLAKGEHRLNLKLIPGSYTITLITEEQKLERKNFIKY